MKRRIEKILKEAILVEKKEEEVQGKQISIPTEAQEGEKTNMF